MSCEALHDSVSDHCRCVHRERSHHANHIPLKKDTPSTNSVLVPKHRHHCRVLVVSELVRLHQGLDIVEGVVEPPVANASNSSSNERDVDGDLVGVDVWRSQVLCDFFDGCKE